EVVKIGSAETAAGRAAAALLDGAILCAPGNLGQVEPASRQPVVEGVAMPSDARRHRAVEGVDTAQGTLHQIVGLANAKQVPWLRLGQPRADELDEPVPIVLGLAQTVANPIAGEAQLGHPG